jgi:thioredoxin-dependent peroxiredoxin
LFLGLHCFNVSTDTTPRRPGAFELRGLEVTALGPQLHVGEEAPDAVLAGKGFVPEPVRLSSFRGKVLILSTVPSLDTGTCDRETRRWEEERKALGDGVEMLTVSMDLPFAQARWCGAADVHHSTASAYMNAGFGIDYGVLLAENHLLGRAVFVIDRDGHLRHVEYVHNIATEPDYESALTAVKDAL